jgi:stearoyl-CoA desaturase (delta-9 desaturase)
VRLLDQFWFLPSLGLALLLWAIGRLPLLVWGFFLRTVVLFHITWAVNSVAHRWGYRNYETPDDSRNNVCVALLSLGEGWHKHHHAFPQSARHGLRRWEIDPAFMFIRLLEKCGLAWNMKLPVRLVGAHRKMTCHGDESIRLCKGLN